MVPVHLESYPVDKTGFDGGAGSHTVAPLPQVATPFGALVVHDAVGRLLTVREVAARLRVSRATVYRLVQAGTLPCVRISNSIRVPAQALDAVVHVEAVPRTRGNPAAAPVGGACSTGLAGTCLPPSCASPGP